MNTPWDVASRCIIGDVAQLARVLDWQSRGRRFEPDLLHQNRVRVKCESDLLHSVFLRTHAAITINIYRENTL